MRIVIESDEGDTVVAGREPAASAAPNDALDAGPPPPDLIAALGGEPAGVAGDVAAEAATNAGPPKDEGQ
jgi:hypothetical protein